VSKNISNIYVKTLISHIYLEGDTSDKSIEKRAPKNEILILKIY
jgi:hypothetical protein